MRGSKHQPTSLLQIMYQDCRQRSSNITVWLQACYISDSLVAARSGWMTLSPGVDRQSQRVPPRVMTKDVRDKDSYYRRTKSVGRRAKLTTKECYF
ncbi:uncharacterized protein PGTG_19460 [Puccinia graminis f. sp. tritici CRL 75-36-700-3]|uniref:Uncharacterized protein n=1 Tax=Puccinia graminis f. sp. tritici (strain CRL 75-36-700-3 / race SCCL) TaxID=418459 RepID=E3LAA9_PUCGT|nr:uncharacterized protein PGTG_19460 [Puccinia graminis f. sp. tritici CRL 75-36-700-3]EFP93484.1 hypothetical protein PGTG_19460 [Puccinia graminis f. sp. tritici CRL 75-36-700-3]